MILTIKQPNKYYEMKTALRERLQSIAESWHLCSRLRERQVCSAFSSFPSKCRMKRALWSGCWGETPPSCARVLSEREKKVSEIGEALKSVGWEFRGAIPVLAVTILLVSPSSQPAELGFPFIP